MQLGLGALRRELCLGRGGEKGLADWAADGRAGKTLERTRDISGVTGVREGISLL